MALICFCHTVNELDILSAIQKGADSIEKIGDFTLAGTGCHSCHPDLERFIKLQFRKEEINHTGQISFDF